MKNKKGRNKLPPEEKKVPVYFFVKRRNVQAFKALVDQITATLK